TVQEFGDDEVLVLRVLVIAAAPDDDAGDAMPAENVAVRTAADRVRVGLEAHVLKYAEPEVRSGAAAFEATAGGAEREAAFDVRTGVAALHRREVVLRLADQRFDLLELHAAHFAVDLAECGDGVADEATLDGADVAGRLVIHAALGQAEDRFGRDGDGGD